MIKNTDVIKVPGGWVKVNKSSRYSSDTEQDVSESQLRHNLTIAAHKVEQIITQLYEKIRMRVHASYLRVENVTEFKVLLLISEEDYHSPSIQAAHIIVEEVQENTQNIDMHFSFNIQSEFLVEESLFANGYIMKHEDGGM